MVNFAANSHVDNSINNPLSFVKSNYVSTLNILVVLSRLKIKNPIFIQIEQMRFMEKLKKSKKPLTKMIIIFPVVLLFFKSSL